MTVCGQAQYRHDKVATNGEIISPSDYQWLCSNDQCVVENERQTQAVKLMVIVVKSSLHR